MENALLLKALCGDVTAQIFWLKNRRPDKWRDKPETVQQKSSDDGFIDALEDSAEDVWSGGGNE